MEIGFVVNDVSTEHPRYTTTQLAMAALGRGHRAWVMGVADFAHDPDGQLRARARHAPTRRYRSGEAYLRELGGKNAVCERISVRDLDVLLLRTNPAQDQEKRPWAQAGGIIFGRLAVRQGVIVLNHPDSLAYAINKTYFQHFPDVVRPRTLITREPEEIRQFAAAQKGRIVLKPLQGSGGQNVFMVRSGESPNLNQMIDAIVRDGYVVAQEYLPDADEGDIRMFVLNGRPLERKGKFAAFRRVPQGADPRSNMHAGGQAERVKMTDDLLRIAETVRPKLVQDGMFLVGLDIVGDKLIEVNVFSPGGLTTIDELEKTNFSELIIESLERKLDYRSNFGTSVDNVTIATL